VDVAVITQIKKGYEGDAFCKKLISAGSSVPGVKEVNGLWYVGSRLLIPRVGSVQEHLFHLAHNTIGHFGVDKSYVMLRDDYYWPNMCRDLQES
jgi:hypothetical protein